MWGIFVGLDTLSSLFAILLVSIVLFVVLWVLLTTWLGIVAIAVLAGYILYRILR